MKLYYFLAILTFLFTSCASSSANKAYCDESVKCLSGYECVKNECEKIDQECSIENKYGFCKEENMECFNGECKTIKEIKCDSITCSDHGACDIDADNKAFCICETGFHPENLYCIKDGLTNCGGAECTDIQHCENNICEENTKLVQCDRDITVPENAEVIITQFEIKWENNTWEEISKCEWACKQGYKQDGNSCIVEIEACSLDHPTGICENSMEICVNGNCQLPPTMGSMCTSQTDCPSDMICILNGIENGYCTKRCTDDTVCGDYKCGDFLASKYCLESCNNILDCRSDFTCNNDKLCRPKCLSDDECKDYQVCDAPSGLCVNQDLNCNIFSDNSCTDSTKSCYPFEEINYTACAKTGILENDKLCNSDNICVEGSICADTDNNSTTSKRCASACKPSQGTAGNNPNCGLYENCNSVSGWTDLGYCKYDSFLVPVGLECVSDNDCDYKNGTCMMFENYNICVASGCPQQDSIDSSTYPNEVICVGMSVNGSWTKYWMDTCDNDSDCYSSNFFCYENTYIRNYCRPRF